MKTEGVPVAAGAAGAFWAAWPAGEQKAALGDTELPHLLASDKVMIYSFHRTK